MTTCLTTLLDDNFLIGARVFLSSFLRHNPWFDHDFVVIDCGLSEESKEILLAAYPKTIFQKVNKAEYRGVKFAKTAPRLQNTYYTLEVFGLPYDRVIFMDMDMLVMDDVSEVFRFSGVIAGCKAYDRNRDKFLNFINTGLFVFNAVALQHVSKARLLEIAMPGHSMPDQFVINAAFKRHMQYLPKEFNVEKRMLHTREYRNFLRGVRVWHFVGAKPWQVHTEGLESTYREIEQLWGKEYENLNS